MHYVWTIKTIDSKWYIADATRDPKEVLQANGIKHWEIVWVDTEEYNEKMKRLYEETA